MPRSYKYEKNSLLRMLFQFHILFNPNNLFTVALKKTTMENSKQMELEILIAVKNSPTLPMDEFPTLFGEDWMDYKRYMISSYNNGLLNQVWHHIIPGLKIWELTGVGKRVLTELLLERSNDLSERLLKFQGVYD
jgi:hypothetical protein